MDLDEMMFEGLTSEEKKRLDAKLYYVLDENNNPVSEPRIKKWAEFMESGKRTIKKTTIGPDSNHEFGEIFISTVFLGIDHSFGDGQLILFETMIFGGKHDQFQCRYSTYQDAIEGHMDAVRLAESDLV